MFGADVAGTVAVIAVAVADASALPAPSELLALASRPWAMRLADLLMGATAVAVVVAADVAVAGAALLLLLLVRYAARVKELL